ncbi:MAG: hypothetical protein HY673_17410 [Chloroflexi bacterium]|nr:hypothetical protein [Chloroflexota bacterium]
MAEDKLYLEKLEKLALDAAHCYAEVPAGGSALVLLSRKNGDLGWAVVRNSRLWGLCVARRGTVAAATPPESSETDPDRDRLKDALDRVQGAAECQINCTAFLSAHLRFTAVREVFNSHPLILKVPQKLLVDDVPETLASYSPPVVEVALPAVRYEPQHLVLEQVQLLSNKNSPGVFRCEKAFYAHPDARNVFFDFRVRRDSQETPITRFCYRVKNANGAIQVKVEANQLEDNLWIDFPGSDFSPVSHTVGSELPEMKMVGVQLQVALLAENCEHPSNDGRVAAAVSESIATVLEVLDSEAADGACALCWYGDIRHDEIHGRPPRGERLITSDWCSPAQAMTFAKARRPGTTKDGRAALEEALDWAGRLTWSSPEAYVIVLGSMEPHPGYTGRTEGRLFDHVACANYDCDWEQARGRLLRAKVNLIDIRCGNPPYPHLRGVKSLTSYWQRQRGKGERMQENSSQQELKSLISGIVAEWRKQSTPSLLRPLELPLVERWPERSAR